MNDNTSYINYPLTSGHLHFGDMPGLGSSIYPADYFDATNVQSAAGSWEHPDYVTSGPGAVFSVEDPQALGIACILDGCSIAPPKLTVNTEVPYYGTAQLTGSPFEETPTPTPESSVRVFRSPQAEPPRHSPFVLEDPSHNSMTGKNLELVDNEYRTYPFRLRLQIYRVMPQLVYKSNAKADHDRYVRDANLQPAIEFWSSNTQECGIPLKDALSGRTHLVDDNAIVMNHGPPSTLIRLQVPGYASQRCQKHQISLQTFQTPKQPLTKGRLLQAVARSIKKILNALAKERQDATLVKDALLPWTITQERCPGKVAFEDLWIASLHNVSQGSWQPHLFLRPDYVIPVPRVRR